MEDVQIIDLYWLRDERAIGETDAKDARETLCDDKETHLVLK